MKKHVAFIALFFIADLTNCMNNLLDPETARVIKKNEPQIACMFNHLYTCTLKGKSTPNEITFTDLNPIIVTTVIKSFEIAIKELTKNEPGHPYVKVTGSFTKIKKIED